MNNGCRIVDVVLVPCKCPVTDDFVGVEVLKHSSTNYHLA